MNLEERDTLKFSIRTSEFATLKKTKEMLIEELLAINIATKGSKEDAVCVTKANSIRIKCTKKKTKEEWISRPKGTLQVLWEQGHIDEKNLKICKKGSKDAFNNFVE